MANGPAPDLRDIAYGPHERNVIDLWKADSDSPTPLVAFIHGGGFLGGDKANINPHIQAGCLAAGISFAAINYRLTGTDSYPAQMHDCARAVQFIRHRAGEWNIDAERIGATGGSAGAGISQWLCFHPDLADAGSEDPAWRQSTRLSCAAVLSAQVTYDPREIRKIVPGDAYNERALKLLFGVPETWDWLTAEVDEDLDARLKDASPLYHLSAGDPPIFIFHWAEQEHDGNIHHANFGRRLKEVMDRIGIECVQRMDTDYPTPEAAFQDMVEFFKRHLTGR